MAEVKSLNPVLGAFEQATQHTKEAPLHPEDLAMNDIGPEKVSLDMAPLPPVKSISLEGTRADTLEHMMITAEDIGLDADELFGPINIDDSTWGQDLRSARARRPVHLIPPRETRDIEALKQLPIAERLIAHLMIIIPLLHDIETTGKELQAERMDTLKSHMKEEIGDNNVIGIIYLFGNLGAAALGAFMGDAAAKIGSGLVQAGTSFKESDKILHQKLFTTGQIDLEEVKKIRENALRICERLYDATARADQAFILRG